MDNADSPKKAVRAAVRGAISGLSADFRRKADAAIAARIRALPEWDRAAVVLAYLALGDEVSLGELIGAARRAGKEVYLPRIIGETIEFRRMDASPARGASPSQPSSADPGDGPFTKHRLGMLEPSGSAPLLHDDDRRPILVVCPGRVFDREGGRVGRGGGHYDRFLARLRETRPGVAIVGVCYSVQVMERTPQTSTDVAMRLVVTESETLRVGARPRSH